MPQPFSIPALQARVQAILLRSGMNDCQAAALSRVITAGERDGCKSHGIYRIKGVLRILKAGKVRGDARPAVQAADGGIVRVDAAGGFSGPAFDLGLPELADRARQLGLAAMVVNGCTHFTALWPEVEVVTAQGLAALAFSPEAFAAGRPGDPFARAGTLFAAITGQGARLPSERRFAARAKAESQGIRLTDAEVAQLDQFLDLGLDAVG